eukprot:g9862.t1
MTVDKVTFVTTRQHLRRQEEPYFRLTPSQLNELLSEYEQARSFEAKLLNQDRMTAELHTYKNREGGLVVLYANDDAEACHAARTLIHRGFDNVFVLSGGLVAFARGGYHCFVEGDIEALPPSAPAAASSGGTGRRGGSLRSSGSGGSGSATGSVPNGSVGGASTGGASSFNGVGGGISSEHGKPGSIGLSGGGGGGGGRRLDYRYKGGQSVVVRGAGGLGNGGSTSSSRNGPGGGMAETTSSVRGGRPNALPAPRGGREGVAGPSGRGRGTRGYPDGRAAAAAVASAPCHAGKSDGGGGDGERPQNITGLRGGCQRGGLVEAAVAASAARRRSMEGEEGAGGTGGGVDMSKGSAITVAESVISRSTARRGRW